MEKQEILREKRKEISKILRGFFYETEEWKNYSREVELKNKLLSFFEEQSKDFLVQFENNDFNDEYSRNYQSEQINKAKIKEKAIEVIGKIGHKRSESILPYEIWLQLQTLNKEDSEQIFYHGTNHKFDQFDDEKNKKNGRGSDSNNFGNAHYFTDNYDFARYYMGGQGEIKNVLINTKNFINISEMYEGREKEEDKKDKIFLLFLAILKENNYQLNSKTSYIEWAARNIALGDKAITDINIYQNLIDQDIYKKFGFEGIIWNKMDEKNEIAVFQAKNITVLYSEQEINEILETDYNQENKKQVSLEEKINISLEKNNINKNENKGYKI